MSDFGNGFNRVVLEVRRALLMAGAQPGLRWWSGDVLTPSSQNVLQALLPGTGDLAGVLVLERSVRRVGSEQRPEGITIFDFTEPHEVVLRQQLETQVEQAERPAPDLPAFASPADLVTYLTETFHLPAAHGGKWTPNEPNQHVTLPDPWAGASSGDDNMNRLATLVFGLRFSSPGQFLQPVLVEPQAQPVPA